MLLTLFKTVMVSDSIMQVGMITFITGYWNSSDATEFLRVSDIKTTFLDPQDS